jgi:hypothetical protein
MWERVGFIDGSAEKVGVVLDSLTENGRSPLTPSTHAVTLPPIMNGSANRNFKKGKKQITGPIW